MRLSTIGAPVMASYGPGIPNPGVMGMRGWLWKVSEWNEPLAKKRLGTGSSCESQS